jgi:serine protease Do
MSLERTSRRFLLALVSGAVLSACSPSASTAVPPVESSAAMPALLPVAAQAIAIPPTVAAPVQPLVTGLPDFTALVERYGPAVVNVRVKEQPQVRGAQRNPLEQFGIPGLPEGFGLPIDPRERAPRSGEGSGFIVSPDGYILTNAHVVSTATEVVVALSDRREFEAKVVGFDVRTDVAVLKVEARDLPVVRIGDPSKLKPGQWVVAIGSPFGMQNSVTAGIVSATSRTLPNDGFVPFIQTDAAVNPGNSGGPLFNLQGEVVGINSQIYSQNGGYMGLSFAIPIDIADNVRDQLVATGRVTRSMIGVTMNPGGVSAWDAEAYKLDRPRGALVADVSPGAPADKAGIRPGDIILSVDGRPVADNTSLLSMVSVLKPGSSAELEIWRDGKLRNVTTRVVERTVDAEAEPAVPGARGNRPGRGSATPPEADALGLSVRPLTSDEKQMVDTQGALVIESVSGAAEAQGLRPGDIILGVGGNEVRTVAELQAQIKASGRIVPLRIQRGEQIQFGNIRKP